MKHLVYLHGFASSARGAKALYLREQISEREGVVFHALDLNPTPLDFEYMTVTGLINRLRQYLLDKRLVAVDNAPTLYLIGSSFGGLVSLYYARRFGGVARLLLLAPALAYLSRDKLELPDEGWERDRPIHTYHYAFQRQLPLQYDIEYDGQLYRQAPPPPPCPITIIHGYRDSVVSIAGSREYAAAYPENIKLIEVDAPHDLNAHLDLIGDTVESWLLV